MVRIAAGVEYDGSAFAGWQSQPHAPSVQDAVEAALSRVANHAVKVVCAGRTDAGVHAFGQVVHFDTDATRSQRSWVLGANSTLPASVNINWTRDVDEQFHARFGAVARTYRYVILNRWVRSAVHASRATWVHETLDAQVMHRAAQLLRGEHDFSSFRALACQAKSPVRTVERIDVRRENEWVILEITANAFLHHMVRNIAGVLIAVGKGERPEAWVQEVLDHKDRELGGVTAPPHGLYFIGPRYPERFDLPDKQLWLPEGER
ncbi:MAG: tRNA pseudouridine(38-40) synthase TruA [Proteobacteria bacterium]|nr:tRNA pseudouridine(38-40) synthase TruA [Pseudomonadota bacterium]